MVTSSKAEALQRQRFSAFDEVTTRVSRNELIKTKKITLFFPLDFHLNFEVFHKKINFVLQSSFAVLPGHIFIF